MKQRKNKYERMEKNGLSEYIESWKKKVLEKSDLVAGASCFSEHCPDRRVKKCRWLAGRVRGGGSQEWCQQTVRSDKILTAMTDW